ncbi:MAG TPA: hypothetical protein VFG68_14270 [Fimbriiglobus sp.]|nr:hypothetical protein [Fimbriiglobus sp.]
MRPTDLADHELRRRWWAWTRVVRAFVTKPGAACRYDPAKYVAAHQGLVSACEVLAAATDGPAREYYRGLGDVVRPWLTTRSLEQADRELLVALYRRCCQIDSELNRGPRAALVLPRLLNGYAVLMAVALGLVIAAAVGGLTVVDDAIRPVRSTFRQLTTAQQLLAAGTVVVAAGGWLLWQTRRS